MTGPTWLDRWRSRWPPSQGTDRGPAASVALINQGTIDRVRQYTMTSDQRIDALVSATRHLVRRGVAGSFVECGVWRGGSVLAILLTLLEEGATDRNVYVYDTFEGMTEPTSRDTSAFDAPALDTWNEAASKGERAWSHFFDGQVFDAASVRALLESTGYPADRIHLVAGRVEDTIPSKLPAQVALLRLDTDWYESTKHELIHLYPLLEHGGVLIIDDYGHWQGCRAAVDEYFADLPAPLLLHPIDYTGRIAIKC